MNGELHFTLLSATQESAIEHVAWKQVPLSLCSHKPVQSDLLPSGIAYPYTAEDIYDIPEGT